MVRVKLLIFPTDVCKVHKAENWGWPADMTLFWRSRTEWHSLSSLPCLSPRRETEKAELRSVTISPVWPAIILLRVLVMSCKFDDLYKLYTLHCRLRIVSSISKISFLEMIRNLWLDLLPIAEKFLLCLFLTVFCFFSQYFRTDWISILRKIIFQI